MPNDNFENQNPYQAPSSTAAPVVASLPAKPFNAGKAFLKWLLVCTVSATPSFFWGIVIGEQSWGSAVAMLLGVLTFVICYTLLECLPIVQKWMQDPQLSLTAKIGYGTRIGISIIFPVGLYFDMIFGMLAMGTTGMIGPGALEAGPPPSFWFYATTIVQGIYLNIVLFIYMLVVYGIIRLVSPPQPQDDPSR